jgi:hypothetical protein
VSGTKTTWAKIEKGAVVELNGRPYLVEKIKPGKKTAEVKLSHKGRASKGEVRLKDPVVMSTASPTSKRAPLQDEAGTMQRWATKSELKEAMGRGLPPGDHTKMKPPEKPKGDLWETPVGRVERKLDQILGARLVGVSTDENVGYYVPPVDASTVAAHLAVFHGGIPEACDDDEAKMLRAHDAQHAAALKGEGILQTNHWHSEKRP